MLLDYFCYSTGWLTLAAAAGSTISGTIAIDAAQDFQCNYLTVAVRQASLIVTNFGGDVQISISSTGKTFFNVNTAIDALRGNAGEPYPFPMPKKLPANTTITVTFVNTALGVATDCQLVFHGSKVYPDGTY